MVDKALVPIEQREVDFYGDDIPAVIIEGGEVYVPVRPICHFLGVQWAAQSKRIKRDPILSESALSVSVMDTQSTPPQKRTMTCLPLDYLNGWLFGINTNRVKPALKEPLLRYQRECYRVLAKHFARREVAPGMATLAHVRDMSLAIATLAQEQMEFEQQTGDRFESVELRLTIVEDKLSPGEAVTNDQASQVSQAVKAVAMKMGEKTGKNEYGGVYGELYRKFGITSYKLLPAIRFHEAMDFLTTWHGSLVGSEPF